MNQEKDTEAEIDTVDSQLSWYIGGNLTFFVFFSVDRMEETRSSLKFA